MNFRSTSAFLLLLALLVSPGAGQQLDNLLSPSRLPYVKKSRLIQISSNDTTGGNNDFIVIPRGATARLADIEGPGLVTQIWLTISSNDEYFLRRIVLRMYWDGEANPSVEVPIGDFFGTGFVYRHYTTPYLGMSSGGYYSYFPMPFGKSARIEVENQTGQEVSSFYYHIDYFHLEQNLAPDIAYFHATWRRDLRTEPGRYYSILEAEGEGHLVGVNLNMQSYDGGLQYLEGDEMIYVDGERKASIRGTGTEDYFNSGWYFNAGEFAAPYHGLILKDDSLGRIAAYRFHILDAIPFSRSIKVLIEHGDRNSEIADYSSTAYWYQVEPHRNFSPLIPPSLRIPLRVQVPNGALEAETLLPTETSARFLVEDMSAYGADWSGMKQLRIEGRSGGDSFALGLPVSEPRYDADLYFTCGPSYGNVGIFSGGMNVGEFSGFSKAIRPGGKVTLKGLTARDGKINLLFQLRGKEAKSGGYDVGLDAFVLRPERKYIPEWNLIGPFPNPRDASLQRTGLDEIYPPESHIDLAQSYTGVGGHTVKWQRATTPASGRVDLSMFDPHELVVAYALTYVYSPKAQVLPLLLGSDDGAKVFLNGKEIHRILTVRVAEPDQDRIPLSLKEGWNSLLLKIENNFGGYNFYARILDPKDGLRYSPTLPK
jgi:hypothetical protein